MSFDLKKNSLKYDITKDNLKQFCCIIDPCSRVRHKDSEIPHHMRYLETVLQILKAQRIFQKDSHLVSGIKNYSYDFHDNILTLEEKAVLFPLDAIKERYGDEFGPMTGVITHCYDPTYGVYAFQRRGTKVSNAGKIQSAAAGLGKYQEKPSDTALRELKEELDIEGELALPPDVFLDINPFMVAEQPQLLLSYVTEADLTDFECIIKESELDRIVERELKDEEVSDKFVVPIKVLDTMLDVIEKKPGFFGPIKESANIFLKWYYGDIKYAD